MNPEVVKVEVSRGVERGRDLIEIEFKELWMNTIDLDRALKVGLEAAAMRLLELLYPITDNVPSKYFFINKTEQNASGKTGKVRIALNKGLGIEDDGLL